MSPRLHGRKIPRRRPFTTVLVIKFLLANLCQAQNMMPPVPMPDGAWRFIVAGDSRNCGDIVMPTIAASSTRYTPSFYWHLGDLRAIYKIDEDMEFAGANNGEFLSCSLYWQRAWPDFIEHQIAPFGSLPFYVGIGNHEIIPPADTVQFRRQFVAWLDQKTLHDQRAADDAEDAAAGKARENAGKRSGKKNGKASDETLEPPLPPTYYHWVLKGVDFIYLDNSSDAFTPEELQWFEKILGRDSKNDNITTVVVGMHEALPDSLANKHSMGDSPVESARSSGLRVYEDLRTFRDQTKRHVYVLASHSHFFMEDIFNTDEIRKHDDPLPGWIIGTGGAERYKLPVPPSNAAKTDVYGYLVGTVSQEGTIEFKFQDVREMDVQNNTRRDYPQPLIHWCFAHNSQNTDTTPKTSRRAAWHRK